MLDPQAECPECGTKLGARVDCRSCGWTPARAALYSARAPHATPQQAPYVPPWERPGFKPSSPDDPCDEPGCTLTIRDHIEAFKRAGERIIARAVRL